VPSARSAAIETTHTAAVDRKMLPHAKTIAGSMLTASTIGIAAYGAYAAIAALVDLVGQSRLELWIDL
jgi:hypothetical protein